MTTFGFVRIRFFSSGRFRWPANPTSAHGGECTPYLPFVFEECLLLDICWPQFSFVLSTMFRESNRAIELLRFPSSAHSQAYFRRLNFCRFPLATPVENLQHWSYGIGIMPDTEISRREELTKKFLKGKSDKDLRHWCSRYDLATYDAPREVMIKRLVRFRAIVPAEVGGCERSQRVL